MSSVPRAQSSREYILVDDPNFSERIQKLLNDDNDDVRDDIGDSEPEESSFDPVEEEESSSDWVEGTSEEEVEEDMEQNDDIESDDEGPPTHRRRTNSSGAAQACRRGSSRGRGEVKGRSTTRRGSRRTVSTENSPHEPEFYLGKATVSNPVPFQWSSKENPTNIRTPAHNILRLGRMPGMSREVAQLGPTPQPIDIWSLLINQGMIEDMVKWTNLKLEAHRQLERGKEPFNDRDYRPTNVNEMKALFGFLILTTVYKANHENLRKNYTNEYLGRPIYRCIMSRNRFEVLTSFLRFDDASTREERFKTNKAAAIDEMSVTFTENCKKHYCIGEYACVDEQLVPFRGKSKLKMYLPKKPCKYGIKIVTLCDAKTGYYWNGYIYCGKGSDGDGLAPEEKKLLKPTQAVLRLIGCLEGSNRNMTADNWFSSVELAEVLLKRKWTYVGTMKKNKREIPKEFQPNRKRKERTSIFGFTKELTLQSYVPKPNRAVILLSSMHHSKAWDDQKDKSEINVFYNMTKGAVDSLDRKCSVYSSNRRSRRWSMPVFLRILNISTLNSYILYNCFKDIEAMDRFEFTEKLGLQLVIDHLRDRLRRNLPRDLRDMIKNLLGGDLLMPVNPQPTPSTSRSTLATPDSAEVTPSPTQPPSDRMASRRKCSNCPYTKNRATNYMCVKCSAPICLECSRKICARCYWKV